MPARSLLYLRSLPTSLTELQATITQAVLFSYSLPSFKYLDIAVTLPSTGGTISRRQSFAQVSAIVNRIYSLTEGIDEKIEYTVILLHEDDNACGGVVRNLGDIRLASQFTRWGYILSTEDVDHIFGPHSKIVKMLEVEPDKVHTRWWEDQGHSGSQLPQRGEHDISCVGGTFDYLHAGHKLLLTMTAYMALSAEVSPRLIVGLTGAELLKNKKHRAYVTSWETRCEAVVTFLRSIFVDIATNQSSGTGDAAGTDVDSDSLSTSSRIKQYQISSPLGATVAALEVHEIQDAFGPTITMEEVTCLVVSEESRGGGQAVNDKRREKGWQELEVFTVGLVGGDGSIEHKLSSTEMRRRRAEKGDITRDSVS